MTARAQCLAPALLLLAGCISPPAPIVSAEPLPAPMPAPEPTAEEVEAAKLDVCEQGEVETCIELAGASTDSDVVLRAWHKACELNHTVGCRSYADVYVKTKGYKLDEYMRAVEKACATDHPGSCGEVAKAKIEGWLAAPDMDAALTAGKRACEVGDETGCRIATVADEYLARPKPKKPRKPWPDVFGNLEAGGMLAFDLECKGAKESYSDIVSKAGEPQSSEGVLAGLAQAKKEIDACGEHWELANLQWEVRSNRVRKAAGDGPAGECVAKVVRALPVGVVFNATDEDRKEIDARYSWKCRATLVLGY